MEKPSEPMYAVPASLLQMMVDFLGDPDTKGSIGKGAVLIGGLQSAMQAGPILKGEKRED